MRISRTHVAWVLLATVVMSCSVRSRGGDGDDDNDGIDGVFGEHDPEGGDCSRMCEHLVDDCHALDPEGQEVSKDECEAHCGELADSQLDCMSSAACTFEAMQACFEPVEGSTSGGATATSSSSGGGGDYLGLGDQCVCPEDAQICQSSEGPCDPSLYCAFYQCSPGPCDLDAPYCPAGTDCVSVMVAIDEFIGWCMVI